MHKEHRHRLRYSFLKDGLEGSHAYEIVELLLTLGTPRKDCKQLAKQALKKIWFTQRCIGNRFKRFTRY